MTSGCRRYGPTRPQPGDSGCFIELNLRSPAWLVFSVSLPAKIAACSTSGPSSTAEQGTHQKRWQRRETFDCEPGELRETYTGGFRHGGSGRADCLADRATGWRVLPARQSAAKPGRALVARKVQRLAG